MYLTAERGSNGIKESSIRLFDTVESLYSYLEGCRIILREELQGWDHRRDEVLRLSIPFKEFCRRYMQTLTDTGSTFAPMYTYSFPQIYQLDINSNIQPLYKHTARARAEKTTTHLGLDEIAVLIAQNYHILP